MFQIIPTVKFLILILLVSVQPESLYANEETNGVRPSIVRLYNKLKREQTVHLGARVGYANKRESSNPYFKAYKRLRRNATEAELVQLCKSESNVILTYAFAALIDRKSPAAKAVFEQHLQDTSLVWHSGGCTGVLVYVNSYMLTCLMPNPGSAKAWMSNDEYEAYFRMVAGANAQ